MSKPTPIADTVGSDRANQGSTSVTKSTLVKRHQRVPYVRRADPYPDPSSVATFERASSAVLKTLSWPQKQFNKWIAADIESSVQAAEKDLVTLDDPFQALTLQSQMSSNTSATIDAPAPAEIRIFSEASQTTAGHGHASSNNRPLRLIDRKTIYDNNPGPNLVKKKLCQRYSSTGTNLTVPAHSAHDATGFTMTTKFLFALLFYAVSSVLQENSAISATLLPQKDLQHACSISEEGVLALNVLTAMRMLIPLRPYAPILRTLAIVNKV
ncbi:hypothetical protein LTS07_008983 [Exophiala sideris]|uniref:Uncharacterized protein n=1 Tax=Exophiala sideris TaxID=1016849 RepID=A0ABR0J2T2_9EURO|nr:hypothetical protein LTS07_008983 [Exophiala sideris]KAK5030124.1 hypothetical protein LTR13_008437 [Exophiala sideris]KAK5053619.1 hypothetical protein LTR69_009264 [Exophiala sideris]